jgi:hypothetical protein
MSRVIMLLLKFIISLSLDDCSLKHQIQAAIPVLNKNEAMLLC